MERPERRRIYFFGQGQADAGPDLKHVVGGKGAGLAEMTRAGLNVPPGFTLSAECCQEFYRNQRRWPDGLDAELRANLQRLEQIAKRPLGRGANPLLVAVRSGAAQSMPGMMDTVLNVGLNPECVQAMGERTGNLRGAWQAYLHFQLMFLRTVSNLEDADVKACLDANEDALSADELRTQCQRLADLHQAKRGRPFPTEPWELLCAAIDAVFGSWMNPRAVTYRESHRIDSLLGTAVNVQSMCASEVSGVMFTDNPVSPERCELLIESAYGLGEAVVLGKVTPDRFVLDKKSLTLKERHIARKETVIATLAADGRGQTGAFDAASLSDAQVSQLAQLGLRVEGYFGHPCDLEWALSQGEFFLLQARAIKVKSASDGAAREAVRREEIAAAQALAAPGGTVWSRFNLSEILPEPTPMTWSIVSRFMSGRGGFGEMYRDLGYAPDPALDHQSGWDVIAGRVYCNLSRDPRIQYGTLPFEYPLRELKAHPEKAIYPTAVFNPRRAGWKFWALFPITSVQMWWAESKRQEFLRSFAERFPSEIVPPFLAEVEAGWREDWSGFSAENILVKLEHWIQRTLVDFARESLKATALAAILMTKFEAALAKRYAPAGKKPGTEAIEHAQATMRELTMGVHPPADADLPRAIQRAAAGKMTHAEFLTQFGHRCSGEMELAQPRWTETPQALDSLLKPTAPREWAATDVHEAWQKVADDLGLQPFQALIVERELRVLHQFLGLREAGKHHLLRGYALIRRALLELDARWQLDGGIFHLTHAEAIAHGKTPIANIRELIAERRARREIALSLPMPAVLFSDDLEAIGREIALEAIDEYQGTPLSAGVGEARAWVVEDVARATPPEGTYILVCPTTDPAWVPLFAPARGLVMETGGVLSHGAIVAREFGLPAVAGIPNVQRRLKTGQRLHIDGARGVVKVLAE